MSTADLSIRVAKCALGDRYLADIAERHQLVQDVAEMEVTLRKEVFAHEQAAKTFAVRLVEAEKRIEFLEKAIASVPKKFGHGNYAGGRQELADALDEQAAK